MTGRIMLPIEAKRGEQMATGRGWRLVNKHKTRAFKARLITTMKERGVRFAIFRSY